MIPSPSTTVAPLTISSWISVSLFTLPGYFLGLFVNLGAQIIDVRGEFVYLRVAILQLRGQSLPYLLTRIGLQLLHE